jgi:hypothetical protein
MHCAATDGYEVNSHILILVYLISQKYNKIRSEKRMAKDKKGKNIYTFDS